MKIHLEYCADTEETSHANGQPLWVATFPEEKASSKAEGGRYVEGRGTSLEAAIGFLVMSYPELFPLQMEVKK